MMKKLLMLTVLIILLAACGNTDEETSSPIDEPVKSKENTEAEKADSKETVEVSEDSGEANTSDKNTDEESQDSNVEGTEGDSALKIQYLSELETIESELDSMPEGETELEMEEIASASYKTWDDALNKIWSELEKQLPNEEMDKLREEQRRWIKDKYKAASEEVAQYEGGSMESLVKTNTQAQITKERCYELVEKYM